MAALSVSPTAQKASTSLLTYEFTKRKRWADLLITELADNAIFILSSNLKVLYCSAAVNELLGWKESEIIDRDFTELVHAEDQRIFRASFDDSLRRRIELLAYIRLKCSSPAATYPLSLTKDILFEVKGYPRYVSDGVPSSGCQFFFAMAKPYLSRNVSMLNTMMELQLENEHLQSKLKDLKSRQHLGPQTFNMSSTGLSPSQRSPDPPNHYYSNSDVVNNAVQNTIDVGSSNAGLMAPQKDVGEEDSEDGIKKKKIKKLHSSEQYVCVTCGRTESPEWRKGPQGPKTLCNACGLRWAKQMRRADDPAEAGAEPGLI